MEKNKLPSFPLYAGDWLSDVKLQTCTFEQQGIYINLLCYSWLDELPNDIEALSRLLRCDKEKLQAIVDKFFEIKGDKICNKKLEKIRSEILGFKKKMSEAGKAGNAKRWQKKSKKQAIAKISPSDQIAIAKVSPSSSSSSSSSKEKDIIYNNMEIEISKNEKEEKIFGNEDVTKTLLFLRKSVGVDAFKVPKGTTERMNASNCLKLMHKIGKINFLERLNNILANDFKAKNCNDLRFLYNELKSFRHSPAVKPKAEGTNSIKFY